MIKNTNNQKGVSLILTIFVMVILLAIVLFVAMLLYTEVRNIKNISDAVTAFFAADSGVEKVLYYDRQVVPDLGSGGACEGDGDCEEGETCISDVCSKPVARGLCAMFDQEKNPDYCQPGGSSLNCNTEMAGNGEIPGDDINSHPSLSPEEKAELLEHGCDADICKACRVSFKTELNDKDYETVAEVLPSADGKSTIFDIKSKGFFQRSSRKVEVYITSQYSLEAITIRNACATPISVPQGEDVYISAEVYANYQGDYIAENGVHAVIKDTSEAANGNVVDTIDLTYSGTYGAYIGTWSTTGTGSYYVDIVVIDTQDVTKIKTNIPPYPICIGY